MARLFGQEVPEIYDGVVEVVSVARDPGSRAKIAVRSKDGSIDPVGACVGMRGSRVQAVVNELQGEKIDIIQWTQDVASFVVNALAPAEVSKVVLDEESERIEVVVPDEQLSLAIGRRGQNVRLASQLTGWDIDIMTEADESERRQKEFTERSALFMQALDVDETERVTGYVLLNLGDHVDDSPLDGSGVGIAHLGVHGVAHVHRRFGRVDDRNSLGTIGTGNLRQRTACLFTELTEVLTCPGSSALGCNGGDSERRH